MEISKAELRSPFFNKYAGFLWVEERLLLIYCILLLFKMYYCIII